MDGGVSIAPEDSLHDGIDFPSAVNLGDFKVVEAMGVEHFARGAFAKDNGRYPRGSVGAGGEDFNVTGQVMGLQMTKGLTSEFNEMGARHGFGRGAAQSGVIRIKGVG